MITKAIVRPPAANFAEALTTQKLGAPDYARALEQHAAYCHALEKCGLELTRLSADERFPDATFVEDTAVVIGPRQEPTRQQGLGPTRRSMNENRYRALSEDRATAPQPTAAKTSAAILTRPGASSRAGEVASIAVALSQFFPHPASIDPPGTLDGGDICAAGEHFFIGISERTNETGAQQLAAWLAAADYSASYIDIRGVANILHLKSGLACLGDNRLVVIDALAARKEFRDYELVRVNAAEAYAANCVRVNDCILVAAGHPYFEKTLRDLGYETVILETTEFEKMDGGLSCLSLRF